MKRFYVLALACAVIVPAAPATAKSKTRHKAHSHRVAVKQGKAYGQRIFPDNFFTVRDKRQVTGRRVNFRKRRDYPRVAGKLHSRCTDATYSICDGFAQLNKLDGFDLQPRVVVPFTGAIKLDSVTDADFFIANAKGAFVSGLRQLTFDPATNTLAGISDKFLEEHTTYRVRVTSGIRDSAGKPVEACKRSCSVKFTTRTASGELVGIRRALDAAPSEPDSAYTL